ncbi:MAG: c-type cytochrome [Myxococcaceae bacterium]|nr:c-type cytochrome [Myxococcaceae bacterium]
MKRQLLAAVGAAAFLVVACQGAGTTSPTYTTSSGSLALSSDDTLLYAADTDNGTVAVVSTLDRQKIADVRVGLLPERLVVGPDDTIYVANRGDRSVSVIRRGQWTEAARISVGVEPSGLGVSPDGSTLFVVNATALDDTSHGTLQAVDTQTLQTRWELALGEEPRGLALLPDGKAAVTLARKGEVVLVDLQARQLVARNGKSLFELANLSALSGATGMDSPATASTFRPRNMTDVVASPDGTRLFATSQFSSDTVLGSDSSGSAGGGAAYGGGPCNAGGVTSPGVVTVDGTSGQALVDDVGSCFNGVESEKDYPATLITTPVDSMPVQGPTAAVVDPTGTWLFVVNRDSNNVAVIPTSRGARPTGDQFSFVRQTTGSAHSVASVGAGPNGIALTRDGRTAWVYSQFDHTLHSLTGVDGAVRQVGEPLKLAEDVLSPDAVAGRKLFHSAVDSRMNGPSVAVSCASCHPDAREDGHVWMFPDGPRQTPALAGRNMTQTAPFHWNGEFNTLGDFLQHTVSLRMGGSGVTAAMTAQLAAFIDVAPAADNPFRTATLDAQQLRGKQVFEQAQCGTCHEGNSFTNNTFADVGTFVRTGPVLDDLVKLQGGLNTPSLLSLSRTAPYLHDGSAVDLKARILQGQEYDLHGVTSNLSDADVDALVSFLKTL